MLCVALNFLLLLNEVVLKMWPRAASVTRNLVRIAHSCPLPSLLRQRLWGWVSPFGASLHLGWGSDTHLSLRNSNSILGTILHCHKYSDNLMLNAGVVFYGTELINSPKPCFSKHLLCTDVWVQTRGLVCEVPFEASDGRWGSEGVPDQGLRADRGTRAPLPVSPSLSGSGGAGSQW